MITKVKIKVPERFGISGGMSFVGIDEIQDGGWFVLPMGGNYPGVKIGGQGYYWANERWNKALSGLAYRPSNDKVV